MSEIATGLANLMIPRWKPEIIYEGKSITREVFSF
jgi:hypothetical protein